jgi:transcriptional regulator with XRE-family HTH domain
MRLRELRESRNENQQKLAVLLNVSQTMISRYELGQATPDVPMLITLSRHYNVSIDYLLENTDVKSPFISSDLTEAETEMLSMFRRLSKVQQAKAEAYIQGLLQE